MIDEVDDSDEFELAVLKVTVFKSFFTGKNLIYVHHNQIDVRGDKLTEKIKSAVLRAIRHLRMILALVLADTKGIRCERSR